MRLVPLALVLVLTASVHATALAQESLVDEGTLVITHNGAPVGREAYRIVRAAGVGGQAYRATATISFNANRLSLRLTTDSAGAPLTYEVEVHVPGQSQVVSHVDGSGRPGRFSTLVRTVHGEAARDYVMGDHPLALDASAFDPYYFATLAPHPAAFATIDPRAGTQATLRFEERGQESIRVGRSTVGARHYALVGGDGATRDIWVDAQGHLLRVAIAAQGLVAQRDDLPR